MIKLLCLVGLLVSCPSEAKAIPYTQRDMECLAKNIYHESRGEPLAGQYAVAYVTLNRLSDPRYPKTICAVVQQRGQFVWYGRTNRISEHDAWKRAKIVASSAVIAHARGIDNTDGAIFFNQSRRHGIRIGKHVFYE
jgi:spore germination cell wall hydrolase CwlJ-like protein